jgi:hypothetical protein
MVVSQSQLSNPLQSSNDKLKKPDPKLHRTSNSLIEKF